MSADRIGSRTANDVDRAVGMSIRAVRLRRGLTQAQLSDRIGVTFQQLQKYERGTNCISAGRLHILATVLQVPIGKLFDLNDQTVSDGLTSTEVLVEGDKALRRAVLAFSKISDERVRTAALRAVEVIGNSHVSQSGQSMDKHSDHNISDASPYQ